MKNIPFILFFAVLAISMYSCQKETITPAAAESEEFVIYEKVFTATDRASNTASVTWATATAVDVRFEIETYPGATNLYTYGWINSTGGSNTGTYTVPTGSSVKLRIKGRQPSGSSATPNLSYTFYSTCSITGCACGNFTVNAPNSIPWSSIPGNGFITGSCL